MYSTRHRPPDNAGFYLLLLALAWAILLLSSGCEAGRYAPPEAWTGQGKIGGVWALDFRHPEGGQLPTRAWDVVKGDRLMHAVHVIVDVKRDGRGRPTSYKLATIGHGPDGTALPPCHDWVDPSVFWWQAFPNIVTGDTTHARGELARGVPWYDAGDTLCIPAHFAADSLVGLQVAHYAGVVPWSF